jgi:hypothetical protein
MTPFDPNAYGPLLAGLLLPPRLPPLGPGVPNTAARPRLAGLSLEEAVAPRRVTDPDMAAACHAALWLYHDFLDESHTLSQEIHTPTGSYWHGLMHRREPDAANAAYWFRRVGEHPVFAALAGEAKALGLRLQAARWDPFAFIDLCEQHRGSGGEQEMLLRRVQQREWELLFDWCYHAATGKG